MTHLAEEGFPNVFHEGDYLGCRSCREFLSGESR